MYYPRRYIVKKSIPWQNKEKIRLKEVRVAVWLPSYYIRYFVVFPVRKIQEMGNKKISKKLLKFAEKSVDKGCWMWYINQAVAERGTAVYLEN